MTTRMRIFCLVLLTQFVTACAYKTSHSYLVPEAPKNSDKHYYQPQVSALSIKAYSFMLADELLLNVDLDEIAGRSVAVTRFVEQDSRQDMNYSGKPLKHLGGQLEESFVYELNKRGYKVIDFKLAQNIKVTNQGDLIWSRNVDELNPVIEATYVVAGTLTPHQNGAVVNLRMVNMRNQKVMATAMGFVPSNLFWADEEVMSRDGILIHKGERPRVYGAKQ